jgi:hypothetical protein
MNTVLYGRVVFGASAVLFGVIALVWHDADTWQNLQHIWSLPFGAIIGGCLMIAQIVGGIGVVYPRTARLASVVLCLVYLCFSLACLPDMVAAANIYDKYGGSFFLFFSFFCGAIALYAATQADAAGAVVFSRVARLGVGICAVSFMLGQALLLRQTAHLVPKWISVALRVAEILVRSFADNHVRRGASPVLSWCSACGCSELSADKGMSYLLANPAWVGTQSFVISNRLY